MDAVRHVLRLLSLSPAARVSLGLASIGRQFKDTMARDTSMLSPARSNRKLIGPCAHQGGSGSLQTLVELDKPLMRGLIPVCITTRFGDTGLAWSRWLVQLRALERLRREQRVRRHEPCLHFL